MTAPDSPAWFKSSYSAGEQDCVEVANMPGVLYVRDSKDKTGQTLSFGPAEFSAFVEYASTLEI
ncbi:DUF397 domain-containing protein [Streptomyces vietnamensis]|uniref:DUF397 domain-containing protein n=1 Tax=Streptomyces vietnamensis TaxID=362257 RepID=A0A0B5IL27_9ACTN|nr:DUF397 domain-containing protein [Streptomyces vietnamensis]AJF70338.1 hypothetical protein SVTN_39660 [Streptomyces vietnamensis]